MAVAQLIVDQRQRPNLSRVVAQTIDNQWQRPDLSRIGLPPEPYQNKMPRRFVRDSKFRHVFGEPYKRTNCYDNVNFTKNMWDGGNYCAVNSKFIAVALEGSGGGNFLVLPIEMTGRIEPGTPKVCGHVGKVLDLKFNPFNANVLASAGEDSKVKIWKIPEGGLTEDLKESAIDLIGHRKKVGIILWHPTANNVLVSAGFEHDLIIWDVEKGSPVTVISGHTDVINSLDWNFDGSLLATSCKDKKGRVIDPRGTVENRVVHEFEAHNGNKPFRIHFVDEKRLVTVGSTRTSEREISLWNTADLSEPVSNHELGQGSGNVLTMFDNSLNMLFIAIKGDCNIRYFEISKETPYVHFLSQYSSSDPQRGFGTLPKRALQVNKCEVFRLYKLNSKGFIEPISMIVPRKSDSFQQDIYPKIPGDSPSLNADRWFSGENADPILISLKDGFHATEKEFNAVVNTNQEENIFAVGLKTAPVREEDLKKSFYQQQDELRELRELLKGKELKIRQLEYENTSLKKKSGTIVTDDVIMKPENEDGGKDLNSSMIAEDTDCSDASSDQESTNTHHKELAADEIEAC